jgi:hypothetical protein
MLQLVEELRASKAGIVERQSQHLLDRLRPIRLLISTLCRIDIHHGHQSDGL